MAKRPKLERMVTPPGIAVWPKLTKPDTQFKKEGEYRVQLRMPRGRADVDAFLEELQKKFDAHAAVCGNNKELSPKARKPADPPWKDVLDEDEKPTGEVDVNFKMTAQILGKDGREGWTQRPGLFDAHRNPIDPENVKVGGGSTIRVSFEVMPFAVALVGCGLSLRMRAVQILNLVEYAPMSAKAMGFEEEEGFDVSSGGKPGIDATSGSAEGDGGDASEGDSDEDF